MIKSKHARTRGILARGMTRYERRLNRLLIRDLHSCFVGYVNQIAADLRRAEREVPRHARKKWRADQENDRRRSENSDLRLMVDFLRLELEKSLESLRELSARNLEFRKSFARAVDQTEADRLLLDYGFQLNPSRRLRHDEKALQRWLSDDAMNDRYLKQRGEGELRTIFILERLGTVVSSVLLLVGSQRRATGQELSENEICARKIDTWKRLGIDRYIQSAYAYGGDKRIRTAAMKCLRIAFDKQPPAVTSRLLSLELESLVQRGATEMTRDVWLQCESIRVMSLVDPELSQLAVIQRLTNPHSGDDLFVRRLCVRLIGDFSDRFRDETELFDCLDLDPSDAVRQQWAQTIWRLPSEVALVRMRSLSGESQPPQVRAALLVESLQHLGRKDLRQQFLAVLANRLRTENDAFVQRTALHVAAQWLIGMDRHLNNGNQQSDRPGRPDWWADTGEVYQKEIIPAIKKIAGSAPEIQCRRWAAEALELIWVQMHRPAKSLLSAFQGSLAKSGVGQTRRLPRGVLKRVDDDTIGRTMAALTQDDFGLDLSRGLLSTKIRRPPVFGFRLWRAWHEFWRPATDKRQAHRHTIGRVGQAPVRAPSRVMAELSKTKVPG